MQNSRFPLTLAQQDIYFDQLHLQDSPIYNVGGYVRFKQLDVEKIHATHQWLINSHDAFGIRVVSDSSGVSQYISKQRTTRLELVDLSAQDSPHEQAKNWIQQICSKPMKIDDCELFRHWLIKLSDDEYWYTGLAHHLAIDGVGYANLVRQFIAHYNGEEVADGSNQWQAVSVKDQSYLSGKKYYTDSEFWRNALNNLADNPLPANYIGNFSDQQLIPSGYYSQTMSPAWRRALTTFADSLEVGISQVFLAILSHYFSISCQQDQLTFGLPLHNRKNAAQKRMIGMFVGISPLCITIDKNASFAQLAQSIQLQQKKNFRHQRFPVGHMINNLPPAIARDRIFDISFNYQQIADIPKIAGTPCKLISISHNHETTPLGLKVMDYGENSPMMLQLDYNQAYFCESEIASLLTRLLYLIETVPKQVDLPLSQLPIIPPSEYQYLLNLSNSSNVRPPAQQCIHQLFETTQKQKPQNIAVSGEGQQLTYQELNHKANQIAHCLISKGVQPNTLVGLCVERSVAILPAILGILKAGGAYVPMDPDAPKSRLHHMINDSAAKLVITQCSLLDKITSQGIETLLLDKQETFAHFDSTNPQAAGGNPQSLAYVIYTSGSTGLPKGVMVTHQNACTLAGEMATWPVCNPQKNWGWNANVVFDASIHGLLRLVTGQQVVVLPGTAKLEPERLIQIVADENIGVIDCTPSMVEMWFNANVAGGLPNLVIGGEAIGDKLWRRLVDWQNEYEDRIAVNIYGPTECCVNITCFPIKGNQPTIGQPLGHVKTYLTDSQHGLIPFGVVAELLIGGACVTKGYLNQPRLTAEKFIQNPFTDDPNDRLYKTGDLVRYLEDGNLAYVGRIDDQIKIRGYRVEPGEIQSQLNQCDNVRESVVVINAQRQLRLVAYVVTKAKVTEKKADFIRYMQAKIKTSLPAYMVPDVFILLDSFTLTPNGKIDKNSLPAPDHSITSGEYSAPRNEREHTLIDIWASLLNLDGTDISVNANFFELGGHSLLAVELATQISSRFNRNVTIADIFQFLSISQLARHLEHGSHAALKLEIVPVERDKGRPLTASFAQQRLYFIAQQNRDSGKYNLPGAWRITGRFVQDIAEQALANIIARHESLRTNFQNRQMTIVQLINPSADFKLGRIDLTGQSADTQTHSLTQMLMADANKAFCLEQDLMLRASFVQLAAGEGVLLINVHHIATDGWSNNLLIKEFIQHYQAIAQGTPEPLPPLSIQYADFASSQRRWIADGLFDSQLTYWEKQLACLPDVHCLPLNGPRGETLTSRGAEYILSESLETLTALKQVAQKNNASLFMLLHSAFALLLCRYSNSDDIVVGIPTANRLQQQLAPLVGFFVNTLVLRIDCSINCDFDAFLAEVKNVHLDAQANQEVPFDLVVERLKPNRSTRYSPLFQIMFAMNSNETTELNLPGLSFEALDNQQSETKFELSVVADETSQGLTFGFNYNTDLFDNDFIKQMAGHFSYLLRSIMRLPECNIHELPLFSETEKMQLIEQLNRR